MFSPRVTNCSGCSEVPRLIEIIDCKIVLESKKLYENILYMLNSPIDRCLLSDLIHYKRILTYKMCSTEDYAKKFTIERIANQIRSKTPECNNCCNTTTSTTTQYVFPTTTTTTTTSGR